MAASGVATANFGAHPGAVDATVDVTGQAGFVAASEVEAWVIPVATADHTVDDHIIDALDVSAYYLADGSFRIVVTAVPWPQTRPLDRNQGAQAHRNFGQWSIGWAWN